MSDYTQALGLVAIVAIVAIVFGPWDFTFKDRDREIKSRLGDRAASNGKRR